jgi:hypothetical protein
MPGMPASVRRWLAARAKTAATLIAAGWHSW